MSSLNLQKIQQNKHIKMGFNIPGKYLIAIYLQADLNDTKGESATITFTFP